MYACGRSLHRLLCGQLVLLGLGLFNRSGDGNAAAQPSEKMVVQTKIFSPQWVKEYNEGNLGCEMGRGSYTWRICGFGSNINHLLNAWVYALAAEGWNDLAVLVDDDQLKEVECSHESKGLASRGWSCLFGSLPHLCVFDTRELWQRHMNSSGVSDEDRTEAAWFSLSSIASADFSTAIDALDVDRLGAKAVLAKIFWRSMTPWLQQAVQVATHTRETFEKAPFIAIHIRRGDKILLNEDLWQDAETYLAAALDYLEDEPSRTPAHKIKGIWVASDNTTVVNEVRSLSHAYFPNVRDKDIVYVGGGVPDGVQMSNVTTETEFQVFASFVYILADLQQLAAADVFVGTFSSNVGRLVMLLREGLGKARSSCISLDSIWRPNRQLRHTLD